MERVIILKNTDTGQALTLPVTPSGYPMAAGRAVERLDMAQTGQIAQYNLVSTQQDGGAAALYGLMQEALRASAYDDPEGHARQILKENGLKTTITVNALGDLRLITGNTTVVKEPVTGICGLFWILSDSHTWTRNLYQTKLTLSLEALMDSQTAGSGGTK